jgi:hypothetical protein
VEGRTSPLGHIEQQANMDQAKRVMIKPALKETWFSKLLTLITTCCIVACMAVVVTIVLAFDYVVDVVPSISESVVDKG